MPAVSAAPTPAADIGRRISWRRVQRSYHGPSGTTVSHGTAGVQALPRDTSGAAAGGKDVSGTAVKGPEGNEYTHEHRPDVASPQGPREVYSPGTSSSSTPTTAAGGATYAHGAAGYGARTRALPTDAGYGVPAARTGAAAYAGYHQTEAVSGSVYAARGAAVRNSYQRLRHVRSGLVRGQSRRLGADRLDGRPGMGHGHLAGGRRVAGLGRRAARAYDYGNNITYQGNQVYYGDQPVATADEYYQQASTLAADCPRRTPIRRLDCRWASSPWSRTSSPTRTTSCSWRSTSRGRIEGNYSDLISGTNVPDPRGRGQKDPARRLDGGQQQDHRRRDGTLQPDPGRGAGADPHRQGQDPAVDAGPAQTARGPKARVVMSPSFGRRLHKCGTSQNHGSRSPKLSLSRESRTSLAQRRSDAVTQRKRDAGR